MENDSTISSIGSGITGIVGAITGLAILAVILSNGSSTVKVIQSFFTGLASLIAVTISPITGGNTSQLAAAAAGTASTNNGTSSVVNSAGNVAGLMNNLAGGVSSLANAFGNGGTNLGVNNLAAPISISSGSINDAMNGLAASGGSSMLGMLGSV